MRHLDPDPPMARGPKQTGPGRRYDRTVGPDKKQYEPVRAS